MSESTDDFIDPSSVPESERVVVRYVPLEDICTDYINPNSMDEHGFLSLVESIKVLGFHQPCIVVRAEDAHENETDTDLPFVMCDGFHRWKALAYLDREVCPCIVADNWDHAKTIIARIAFNKNRGQLNLTAVAGEVHALHSAGYDVEDLCVTGYTEDEVSRMIAAMETDVDSEIQQIGNTSVIDDDVDPGANPRPFLLEVQFATKDQRNSVRRALKNAGNGDVSLGMLTLAGLEE